MAGGSTRGVVGITRAKIKVCGRCMPGAVKIHWGPFFTGAGCEGGRGCCGGPWRPAHSKGQRSGEAGRGARLAYVVAGGSTRDVVGITRAKIKVRIYYGRGRGVGWWGGEWVLQSQRCACGCLTMPSTRISSGARSRDRVPSPTNGILRTTSTSNYWHFLLPRIPHLLVCSTKSDFRVSGSQGPSVLKETPKPGRRNPPRRWRRRRR